MSSPLPEDPRAWPPIVPLLPALTKALPVGRAKAYELAASGNLPFVRRLGSRYLIVTSQLLAYLGMEADPGSAERIAGTEAARPSTDTSMANGGRAVSER